MTISKEQIQYIDKYLQFLKVEFLDVRVELIDHLASEFETISEHMLLEDFLRTKKAFVKKFQKNLHNKKHWGYQKRLFKRILYYFEKPNYLLISICLAALVYAAVSFLPFKFVLFLFITTVGIPQIIPLYIYKKPREMHKKIQSARYILSIMGFPSLFWYIAIIFKDIPENPVFFMVFWFFALISNLAGLEEVVRCKKQVLGQYKQLVIS